MIYLDQNQNNQASAVCSRNKTLVGNVIYLWSMSHKLSNKQYRFIPYRLQPTVSYSPAYDIFCIDIDESIPEVLTGATSCGETNVHLIPGEYYLKVYEQYSSSNLNPMLSHDVVYETLVNVIGINQSIPVSYSGNSDIFIIYNAEND